MIPYRDAAAKVRLPPVTTSLIVLNLITFALSWWFLEKRNTDLLDLFALIPAKLTLAFEFWNTVPPLWTFITAPFLHSGPVHLFGNMLFLWIFGNRIEEALGTKRFLIFYLLCGATALLIQYFPEPYSDIPVIGASGAIAGILGAYFLLFPDASIQILVPLLVVFRIITTPAWVLVGIWILLQIAAVQMNSTPEGDGGVAYYSHVGGFLAGMLFARKMRLPGKRKGRRK